MLQARRHTHGSLARFMFNEMFGRFLENLHYTATTGPVAGRQPGLPLLPVHLLPPLCTCLCLKKCTKWRALSARQLVVPLSSFILPVEQGNRIFVAGKRDCQVFHCTGTPPPPLPAPCSVAVGARIMHEVVIIRANSIENFVPNVRFAGGSSALPLYLPLSFSFPLSRSLYCSLSLSPLLSLPLPALSAPPLLALLILTKGKCATANEFGRN